MRQAFFRRFRLLTVAFALLFLLVVVAIFRLLQDGITRETFSRIEVGAGLQEVETLLRRKADHSERIRGSVADADTFLFDADPNDQIDFGFHQWNASQITIVVITDAEGRVVCRYCSTPPPAWQQTLTNVRRNLRTRAQIEADAAAGR